jgi:hypothetical protein
MDCPHEWADVTTMDEPQRHYLCMLCLADRFEELESGWWMSEPSG